MTDEKQDPFHRSNNHAIEPDELRTFVNTPPSERKDLVFMRGIDTSQKKLLKKNGGSIVQRVQFAGTAHWMEYSVEKMRRAFAATLTLVELYPHAYSFFFHVKEGSSILEVYAYDPEEV